MTLALKESGKTLETTPGLEHNSPRAGFTWPSHEEISRHAYEIYVNKGFTQGQSKQNWLQAESELKNGRHGPV